MQCNFQVGQKVVCKLVVLSDWAKSLSFECPVVGKVYTIRAINVWPRSTLLRFEELRNERFTEISGKEIEPGFPHWYFEPVVEPGTETGMSILRELLNTQDKPLEVVA